MQREIFYDLTEAMFKSGDGAKYYGILRVVAEIAFEFVRKERPVRFCIFNFADGNFYEVSPAPDASAPSGIALNVPRCRQIRVRTIFNGRNLLRDGLTALAKPIARRINRKRWAEAGPIGAPLSLDGARFVSASRPKLISEMMRAMEAKGWDLHRDILLHDLIPLYTDDGTGLRTRFASNFYADNCAILRAAEHIIGNSQFTCDDIARFAEAEIIPAPKSMTAIPLVHECDEGTEAPEIALPERPFLLAVGTQLGRKNLDVIFAAMKRQIAAGGAVPLLVLAGQERKRTLKFLEQEENAPLRAHVQHILSPNQTDLVRLYRAAEALILASHIEGWGLPTGEALWNGTPVLASDIPVLREVCGDLAWYFPPEDAETLAGQLERLLTDPEEIAAWRARIAKAKPGLRRWSDVADDFMQSFAAQP